MTDSEHATHRVSDRLARLDDLELVRIARLQLPYVTAAYEVLFHRYHGKLVQVCYRYLGSIEEAEEAVSDTMLKVFNCLAQFAERASFKTWIYRIAYNQALDRLRKKKIDQVALEEADESSQANFVEQSSGGVERIDALLAQLSVEDRSIVVFRIAGDLEFSDIAIVVDQKLSTVKMRYKRALEKMAISARSEDEKC